MLVLGACFLFWPVHSTKEIFAGNTYMPYSSEKSVFGNADTQQHLKAPVDSQLNRLKTTHTIEQNYQPSQVNTADIRLIEGRFLLNTRLPNQKLALDNFFEAITNQSDTAHVHVAFYGDSQIEGDRVTSDMRGILASTWPTQQAIGFVPIIERSINVSVNKTLGGNWLKYSFFDKKHPKKRYGASGMTFKFSPPSASIKLKFHRMKHKGYHLSYGKTTKPLIVNVYDVESWKRIASDTLKPDSVANANFHRTNWSEPVQKVKFEFISQASTEVFGLYLYSSGNGIQIDNYGLLGHSGYGFLSANASFMASQHRALNTRLIILQFGANAMPYINSPKEYDFMRKEFGKTIQKIKEICPQASILILGPGEMARRVGGSYKSYGNAQKFANLLKGLAQAHGAAFFDLHQLMGGTPNLSAWQRKKWVYADGHLTEKGHYALAKALSDALLQEWSVYQQAN